MPVRNRFDWPRGALAEALGRIHFAGASIVVMGITDSPYTQAEADGNTAAAYVVRPAAMKQKTLRDRTRLWKVR